MKIMTLGATAVVASLVSSGAMAQNASVQFRLAGDARNMAGCANADASMTRVHTLTMKDGVVELTSSGGINDKLKQVSPNVYKTDFTLGSVHLDITADLGATPKALNVVEKSLGCKWHATAP